MLNIVIKEIKELCADKKIWIGILTVLIMIIIGTSYNRKTYESSREQPLKLGIINHDGSTYSKLLVDNFKDNKTFSGLAVIVTGNETKIKEAFLTGRLDIYLEIPKNFADNMIHLNNSPVRVTMNISDTTKAIIFRNVLKSYEKYISAVEENAVGLYEIMDQDGINQEQLDKSNREISVNLILTALGREDFFAFKPVEKFPAVSIPVYYLSSILVTAFLYFGLYAGFQVLKELELGTFLRLQTTRTNIFRFIAAKMALPVILLTAVMIAALSLITGKLINLQGWILAYTMSMLCVSFTVFLCALLPTKQRYILAGNLLIFFFTVLGGGIIPVQYLPQNMIRISEFTPNYYMLKEIALIINERTINGSVVSAMFLISLTIAGFAILIFRRRRVITGES